MLKPRRVRFGMGVLMLSGSALVGCERGAPTVVETPPPTVSVSQPLTREVTDYADYEGRIAAVETVEVRARVRGHLVKVNFQDGNLVKKGDILFEIDPRPYQASLDAANAQVKAAEASLQLANVELDRTERLAKKGAASREELDVWIAKQATAAAEKLKQEASVEQAQLDLGYTKIVAEIDGRIGRVLVTVGNLINSVGGETLLATIVSVEPMYVYFDVDERTLLRYREIYRKPGEPGSAVKNPVKDLQIPVIVGLEGETGHPHKGVLDFADNVVNPSTGTIQVRGVLPNPQGDLSAGMRARVRVPEGNPRQAMLITERAIGTDQGRRFVYVVGGDKLVERRDVELGRIEAGGLRVVAAGLKPEDWIVVNGIQRVRDGAKVEPKQIPMPEAPSVTTTVETKS